MLGKAFLVAAGVAFACHALAQTPAAPEIDSSLPQLPPAADLSNNHIGQHFLLKNAQAEEEVFFAGYGPAGPLAFSASDVPKNRLVYQDAAAHCMTKGAGWRLPAINELRVVSPLSDAPDPDYLPGSYWTTTEAPCIECGYPDQYKMAYDIRSGHVRNGYTLPFTKFYTACAYQIP